jgi:hypothetical protein
MKVCASFCLAFMRALIATVGSANAAAIADTSTSSGDISGVWWANRAVHELRPLGGEPIPLTPQGAQAYQANKAGLVDGSLVDRARHTCLPQGTPRAMLSAYPFLIVQTPSQVTLMFEENRIFRIVRLNAQHEDPNVWDPSFMGESVGHWEGPALVIDTQNFKTTTFLDDTGLPHSDQLHVIERLKTVRGGKLQDLITVIDPVNFTKPWTAQLSYEARPTTRIQTDWVCGEPHRALQH